MMRWGLHLVDPCRWPRENRADGRMGKNGAEGRVRAAEWCFENGNGDMNREEVNDYVS